MIDTAGLIEYAFSTYIRQHSVRYVQYYRRLCDYFIHVHNLTECVYIVRDIFVRLFLVGTVEFYRENRVSWRVLYEINEQSVQRETVLLSV